MKFGSTFLLGVLILLLVVIFMGGIPFLVRQLQPIFSDEFPLSQHQHHHVRHRFTKRRSLARKKKYNDHALSQEYIRTLWSETNSKEFNDDTNFDTSLASPSSSSSSSPATKCLRYRYIPGCTCLSPSEASDGSVPGSLCAPDGAGRCFKRRENSTRMECLLSPVDDENKESTANSFRSPSSSSAYFLKTPSTKTISSLATLRDLLSDSKQPGKNDDDDHDHDEEGVANTVAEKNYETGGDGDRVQTSAVVSNSYYFFAPNKIEDRIKRTLDDLSMDPDERALDMLDFHRRCREQRRRDHKQDRKSASSSSTSSSSSTLNFRCRADSLPQNDQTIPFLVSKETEKIKTATTTATNNNNNDEATKEEAKTNPRVHRRRRLRLFCMIENHFGISKVELSIAACFGVGLDLVRTMTKNNGDDDDDGEKSALDIVLPYFVDHRRSTPSEPLEQLFDVKFLREIATKYYGISEVLMTSQEMFTSAERKNDPCTACIWKEVASVHCPICCVADSRLLVTHYDGDGGGGVNVNVNDDDDDRNKLCAFLPLNTDASYAERNHGADAAYRAMSIVGTPILRREISHFESANAPSQWDRYFKRELNPRRWYSTDRLLIRKDEREWNERKSVFLKMKQQHDKKYSVESVNLIERDRDWNWCLNRTRFSRFPILEPALARSSEQFVVESEVEYHLSLRITGLSFTTLHEYRSGSWLPSLDWIQPSSRARKTALRYLAELRTQISSHHRRHQHHQRQHQPRHRHFAMTKGRKNYGKKKILGIHLRFERDAISTGWFGGGSLDSAAEYPKLHRKINAMSLEQRQNLLQHWTSSSSSFLSGRSNNKNAELDSMLRTFVFVDGLLTRIERLAREVLDDVGAVFVTNHEMLTKIIAKKESDKTSGTPLWFSRSSLREASVSNNNISEDHRKRLPEIDDSFASRFGALIDRMIVENSDYALIWDPFTGLSSFSQKIYDHRCRRMVGVARVPTFSYSFGIGEERDESFVLEC